MNASNVVDKYLKRLEENPNCKMLEEISGTKYSILEENKRSKIQRFIIDENLDAIIYRNKAKKTCKIKYINESDLLIIGFCLNGEKKLNYNGKKYTIKKGEAFYFRPIKDFVIEFSEHNFLYYFLDLSFFRKSMNCRKRDCHCKKKNCNSYVDNICNRGEVIVKKVPYAMETYAEEIKEIENLEIHNFLDYTNLKGQLFNYLNWFIKFRVGGRGNADKRGYGLCYASKAKNIIRENLEDPPTVKEIAEILDITIYRLQNSFKKTEGTTVYNFILRERMEKGKLLLKDLDLTIIDISQKIGYENPSKFSTAFKSITGYTPTEYRSITED